MIGREKAASPRMGKARIGERIVITQQDLIADINPGYFDSYESFDEHRTLTRQALSIADAVVFISEHVRHEAVAAELNSTLTHFCSCL